MSMSTTSRAKRKTRAGRSVGGTIPARRTLHTFLGAAWALAMTLIAAAEPTVRDLALKGQIDGENIRFTLTCMVVPDEDTTSIELIRGDTVIENVRAPIDQHIGFDPASQTYTLEVPGSRRGWFSRPDLTPLPVDIVFGARPTTLAAGWREATFEVPRSQVRQLSVICDRTDLDVQFPDALRVRRSVDQNQLTVSALLGPGRPFIIRWKPQVEELEGKLVLSAEVNTLATVTAGALRLDCLYAYEISQGKLDTITISVPPNQSITQVKGEDIREWSLEDVEGKEVLRVVLSRPRTGTYTIQILAEAPLGALPLETDVALPRPMNLVRERGSLAIGTDHAIQLQVLQAGGLSQIDVAALPRLSLDPNEPRQPPANQLFCYTHVGGPLQLHLALADIVPSYDVNQRITLAFGEEDLDVTVEMELDIRDAPIRRLQMDLPAGLSVAEVTGDDVEDFAPMATADGTPQLQVTFASPVQGRKLITVRLEMGRSPLDTEQTVTSPNVVGARSLRGHVLVTSEEGVRLDTPVVEGLREVHAASLPVKVADARFAYRFREPSWSLTATPQREPATVLAEVFHLLSIGEGIVYGNVVVNYVITGAPVDRLRFTIPGPLRNVEFIGTDVRRWTRDGDAWEVLLQRKVIGEYNLGVAFTQPLTADDPVLAGGISCAEVATQRGFVAVASRHNLQLTLNNDTIQGLIPIDREEIPDHYRLLINAPVLVAFKYLGEPHQASLATAVYPRGDVVSALIEMTDVSTHVTVDRHRGNPQTVTELRCKVKNLNRQFLSVRLPEATSYSRVRLVTMGPQGETSEPVAVRQGTTPGMILIPLKRLPNPNDPLTLVLEYGQNHAGLKSGDAVALQAPDVSAPTTFTTWTVYLDDPHSILLPEISGCSSPPLERLQPSPGPFALALKLLNAWAAGVGMAFGLVPCALMAGAMLVALVTALLRRARPRKALGAAILAGVCILGFFAATRIDSFPHLGGADTWATLTVTQAAVLGEEPASVAFRVVPTYRRWLGHPGVIPIAVACLIALAAAVFLPRWWRFVPLTVLAGGLVWALPLHPLLGYAGMHVFTWFLPLLLSLGLLLRARRALSTRVAVAAMLLLCGKLMGQDQADVQAQVQTMNQEQITAVPCVAPIPIPVDINHLSCHLQADVDVLRGTLDVTLPAGKRTAVAVLPKSAIVLSPTSEGDALRVHLKGDQYVLEVAESREPTAVSIEFLLPLPSATADGTRSFVLPLPPALTKAVVLSIPGTGLRIESPTAILFEQTDSADSAQAEALIGPTDAAHFIWKPRERQTQLEKTVFFADSTCLVRIDAGVAQAWQQFRFQVAQGELGQLRLKLPDNMTVTAVVGEHIGAWRFDPIAREVDVRIAPAVTGSYDVLLQAQFAFPSDGSDTLVVAAAQVPAAERQRLVLGVAQSQAVALEIKAAATPINTGDFIREAQALTRANETLPTLHSAYRLSPDQTVSVAIHEVEAEIRVAETAGFTVSDERLVYTGELLVTIAKAGRFNVLMSLPDGYDVDSLSADEVSHWDEAGTAGKRQIRIHFRRRIEGTVNLRLALSRPVAELPPQIIVPRVSIDKALRHTGSLSVSSDRSVRLSVDRDQSTGISDVSGQDPALRRQGVLSFKLLGANWGLSLRTEVIRPRITMDFLHVARVSEGLIRHTHTLRYQMQHAGVKQFRFRVPSDAVGVQVSGPDITRRGAVGTDGMWEVELAQKQYDRPYLLRVTYESRFDRDEGLVTLLPVSPEDVDLQRGYVAILTGDRVELMAKDVSPALQPVDARHVPTFFGAGQLAQAAFCYRSVSGDYRATLTVRRHESAGLQAADVREAQLESVVSRDGSSLNRLRLMLTTGGRRHVRLTLPEGSRIWSLMVNQMAQTPALETEDGRRLLVALPEEQGSMDADISLVYVIDAPAKWNPKAPAFSGPTVDLPLKNLRWILYLPEGIVCKDFEGSLNPEKDSMDGLIVSPFGAGVYDVQVLETNQALLRKAEEFQNKGAELAQQGKQMEAKVALQNAYNYSQGDAGLNEDARVQLHSLIRQQAIVGLVGRRNQLRSEFNVKGAQQTLEQPAQQAMEFNPDDALKLQNSLSKQDNDNLERITGRIIESQEAALGAAGQLAVTLPEYGTQIALRKSLLVEPDAPLNITFKAESRENPLWPDGTAAAGMGLAVAFVFTVSLAGRKQRRPPPVPVDTDTDPDMDAEIDANEDEQKDQQDPNA